MSQRTISLIGVGDLGGAFLKIQTDKGYPVNAFFKDENKLLKFQETREHNSKKVEKLKLPRELVNAYLTTDKNFNEIIPKSDIIELTIPSLALPEILNKIEQSFRENLDRLSKQVTIVLTSKGADIETGLTPYKLAKKIFPKRRYPRVSIVLTTVVGFADGIAKGEPPSMLISGRITDKKSIRLIKALLNPGYFVMEHSFHPNDVCLTGMIKNTGAILIGICEGIKTYTFQNGLKIPIEITAKHTFKHVVMGEMRKIAKELGINSSIIEGLAGREDLDLSCNPEGRNWSFGYRLAKGENMEDIISDIGTIEGIGATKYLAQKTDSLCIGTLNKLLNERITLERAAGIILRDFVPLRLSDSEVM